MSITIDTNTLDATVAVAAEKPMLAVALPDIAERAGVSVQTVLRQFGSRDGLFDATEVHVRSEVVAELEAPPGDLDAILDVLMAHYELRGDDVLMFLGQERWEPRAAEITDEGRRMHLAWVQKVFAPFLPDDADEREAVIDLLMVATDVYTWKILRRDRGLSIEETARRVRRIVVLAHARQEGGIEEAGFGFIAFTAARAWDHTKPSSAVRAGAERPPPKMTASETAVARSVTATQKRLGQARVAVRCGA